MEIKMHRSIPRERMDTEKTRWQSLWSLFILVILWVCLIFFITVIHLRSSKIVTLIPSPQRRLVGFFKGFLPKIVGCRIADMDPFDPSIKEHIFQEPPIICNNGVPPLMESNLTSLYVLKTSLAAYNISDYNDLKCCYSLLKRAVPKEGQKDDKVTFNRQCVAFNETRVISEEFVRVTCLYNGSEIYKDCFSFVPIKPKLEKISSRNQSLNVLVVGMDSVSRLNLHRQMPKTVQMLKDLNVIEMRGYNTVGDSTYPNLIPVLTGLTRGELTKSGWETRFDDYSSVLNNYRNKGFTTVFGEDSASMGMFNKGKLGILKEPTDYFWGPYNRVMEQQIGNQHSRNGFQCVGARLAYNALLEYINKFVQTMHMNMPFFGFFWSFSLSHDYLNKPKLGDEDYANFISNLNTSKIFDDTVLIFMSDHGLSRSKYGSTSQGRMENCLPFLFILLPQKYRETCYHSYINLQKNINRLTTPFDLHETLNDLLNPYALTEEALDWRSHHRYGIQRGYSLFEPIPANRTCKEAGIEPKWCIC